MGPARYFYRFAFIKSFTLGSTRMFERAAASDDFAVSSEAPVSRTLLRQASWDLPDTSTGLHFF
jgi:hypothetical protein